MAASAMAAMVTSQVQPGTVVIADGEKRLANMKLIFFHDNFGGDFIMLNFLWICIEESTHFDQLKSNIKMYAKFVSNPDKYLNVFEGNLNPDLKTNAFGLLTAVF